MTGDCEENDKETDDCEKDENGKNNLIGEQLDTSKSTVDGGQKNEENEKQVKVILGNYSDFDFDLLFRVKIRRRESRKLKVMVMIQMKKEEKRRSAMRAKEIQTRDQDHLLRSRQ